MQMFWDPEPSNDTIKNLPAWCLGRSYKLGPRPYATKCITSPSVNPENEKNNTSKPAPNPIPLSEVESTDPAPDAEVTSCSKDESIPSSSGLLASLSSDSSTGTRNTTQRHVYQSNSAAEVGLSPPASTSTSTPIASAPNVQQLDTPTESVSSSFDSSLAYEEMPNSDNGGWPVAFLDDVESRIWITYRSEFELIPKSRDPDAMRALSFTMRLKTQFSDQPGFSSDTGWGCMIRTGQSLLANAKCFLQLGRDWRRSAGGEEAIIADFADDPRAPYSIHNFVSHGSQCCGKYPGEWFGPSATARCIQALANKHESDLRVYSTGDGHDVYTDTFMKTAKGDDDRFHPTLVLVSTRLGIDKITPVYWEALIASLQMRQSVGIAGGRPSSSLYFFGAQGQYLFYLDPHHTRIRIPYRGNSCEYTREEINSCHTRRLRRIHVRDLDPSMLIGFLIRDEQDWEDWKSGVKHVQGKSIINVGDRDPLSMGEGSNTIDIETLSDDEESTLDDIDET